MITCSGRRKRVSSLTVRVPPKTHLKLNYLRVFYSKERPLSVKRTGGEQSLP